MTFAQLRCKTRSMHPNNREQLGWILGAINRSGLAVAAESIRHLLDRTSPMAADYALYCECLTIMGVPSEYHPAADHPRVRATL